MSVTVRVMEPRDVEEVGDVMVSAFNDVFSRHGYAEPFPSVNVGISLARSYLDREPEGCFTAWLRGTIVGSGFVHIRGDTGGIGPVTVDPRRQSDGVGRALMTKLISAGSGCSSLRLVQDAFNVVSFPLYSRLGFDACGTAASIAGEGVTGELVEGLEVRNWSPSDMGEIERLDRDLTGISREQDLLFFHSQAPQLVAFAEKRLVGYLCILRTGAGSFLGPGVGIDETVLRQLIVSAARLEKNKTLRARFPTRHGGLLRDLLNLGFRVENLQTYMVRGEWSVPRGVDLLALFPEAL